jgi:alcohol dehydrogenase
VVALGRDARRRLGVAEGDRVVLEYAFGCGECEPCLGGRYTLCDRNFTYGSMLSCQDPPHLYGGYSEYVYLHPRAMVHRLDEEIPPEVGVLVCAVLGNGIRWLSQVGRVSLGTAVAIVGPGLQGLAGTAAAKASGASPVIVLGLARDRNRLAMARRFGADWTLDVEAADPLEEVRRITGGRMADVVMDVSGNPQGARLALSLAGKSATVILPGLYKSADVALDLNRAVVNEIKLVGVYSHDFQAVRRAIRMVRDPRYPFGELISHRFPLEAAEQALTLVGGHGPGEPPLKVLLDPRLNSV